MLPVLAPPGINWFYESQARNLAEDLTGAGVPALAVAAHDIAGLRAQSAGGTVLIMNYSECLIAAERAQRCPALIAALAGFEHRILINYDTVFSHWFANQFPPDAALPTAVIDITMIRQIEAPFIRGIPYVWVPEAFSAEEAEAVQRRQPGRPLDRPLPWAVLGHATADRAAFASAAIATLGADGFVFLPPHRPFTERSGLDRVAIGRVLARSDLYLWSSHHGFPYHEGFRALHAVAAGAVPAKIDPLNIGAFAGLPWVYPNLEAVREAKQRLGLDAMYQAAFEFVARHGTLGRNVATAIAPWYPPARAVEPAAALEVAS